jgi:predicted glycoside hydrolase/deacetylase ChbG (UPF0249 family)
MQFLIVNADDFGFSKPINEGVCEAYRNGIVTDASLLVRSPFARHALELAQNVGLPVGLHIDFVTFFAGTDASEFGPNGRFLEELFNREYKKEITRVFTSAELLKVRQEIRRQIADFRQMAGRLPTHLDYHFGLHFLPDVMAIYLLVAEEYGLPVRWGTQYAGENPLVLAPARLCDRFRGVENGGPEQFACLLAEPWKGVLEVLCHPGYYTSDGLADGYNREREYELQILTHPQLKARIEEMGIQRVNYDWLNEHRGSDLL